ncbi:TlpA family protein disulfide reductase [Belliella marina]|uniref:TlpA family protein disulfide reductase n=1 Tax=Belliella marina TaxID=1644146 RepID=A0ABW4VUT6_9BACT
MKNWYLSFLLLTIGFRSHQTSAQTTFPDQIEVELENMTGKGPFMSSMSRVDSKVDESNPFYKADPSPLELPEDMIDFKQYHIIPNFIQFAYQSFKNGLLEESHWKEIESRYHGEEILSNLSEDIIRCYIRLASRQDSVGNVDIWVDSNGNDKVEQEEIHHYPISLKNTSNLFGDENLIEAVYEKYSDNKIVSQKTHLNLNPFAYPDFILYNFSEHQKGKIQVENEELDIYLSNGFTTDYYVNKQFDVFFHDDPRDFKDIPYEEKEYLQYQDIVFIKGEKYQIGKTSPDGSILTLTKYPEDKEWIGTQVGAKAIPIESRTLDSIPYNLYNGKITMLDFWGSWCGPCVNEIPFLKDAASFFEGDQFELVGIVYDTRKTVESFISKNDVFWKQVMHKYDKSDSIDLSQSYGISGYPTTFLIDQDNKIAIRNKGLRSYELYKTLSKYLQKDPNEFLDFITSGDFKIIISSSELKISAPHVKIGQSDEKLYAYPKEGKFLRGLSFGNSSDEISFTLNYFDENHQPVAKPFNIKKEDISNGIFEIKL